MDKELLVNTRKKRANAGSRLKQLLSAEVPEEDVDLLFVEDEDDVEYGEEEQDEEDHEDEEGEETGESEGGAAGEHTREGTTGAQADDEGSEDEAEGESQDDDMFSDSSEESSEEDSDAGEKELEKQERVQRSKKKHVIQKIRQPALPKPKVKKVYERAKADSLLSQNRRQSSRTIAVQNKLVLAEKLRDEEKRRASAKPVVRVEYKEMTQEERLAEAIETEKYNVSTLNKYQEQEVDKQKKRREQMMNKRRKLTDVMTIKTYVKYVEIEEERELEKFLLTRDVLKKRERRGRRSERQKREEEEALRKEKELKHRWELLNNPDKPAIQVENEPISSVQDELKANTETQDAVQVLTDGDNDVDMKDLNPNDVSSKPNDILNGSNSDLESKQGDESNIKDETLREEEKQHKEQPLEEEKEDHAVNIVKEEMHEGDEDDLEGAKENIDVVKEDSNEDVKDDAKDDVRDDVKDDVKEDVKEDVNNDASGGMKKDLQEETNNETKEDKPENKPEDDIEMESQDKTYSQESKNDNDNNNDGDVKEMNTGELDVDRSNYQPSLEGDNQEETKTQQEGGSQESKEDTKTSQTDDKSVSLDVSEPIIYEGPKQKVGVNVIAFEHKYSLLKLRSLMFGDQSTMPLNRRSLETEPVARIKLDPDLLNERSMIKTSIQPIDFSILDTFPEFGDFNKKIKRVETVKEVETTSVVLKTPPPSGITLKNGNRKMCLITGKDAMYFHPGTGMPYSSVESFKVINDVQNGEYKWVEGCFVSNYHAKGVPKNFDP